MRIFQLTCCYLFVLYMPVMNKTQAQTKGAGNANKPKLQASITNTYFGGIPLTTTESKYLGKVKTVITNHFNCAVIDDSLIKTPTYQERDSFNKDGYLVKQISYNRDGKLDQLYTYHYDRSNNPLYWEAHLPYDGLMRIIFKYDKEGHNTEQMRYKGDGVLDEKKIIKYDNGGHRTEETEYNAQGKKVGSKTFKYDEKGNLAESTELIVGAFYWKWVSNYDQNGYPISGASYTSEQGLPRKWTSKNDKNGNCIEWRSFHENGKQEEWTVKKYDANGRLVSTIRYNEDGSDYNSALNMTYENKYDDKGNITEQTMYNIKGKTRTPALSSVTEYVYY